MRTRDVLVSIIIPVFGRTALAEAAVASAAAQRSVACEVIVVDDGSPCDTHLLRQKVESAGGRFIWTEHRGIAHARNVGIAAAAGQWIAFLDSDDLFFPDKLEKQLAALRESSGSRWSCCGFDLITYDGRTMAGTSLAKTACGFWLRECPFGATSLVVCRNLLRLIGGFDESFAVCEDWELVIRLGRLSPPCIIREALYSYRTGCDNVTSRGAARWVESWRQLAQKHGVTPSPRSYMGAASLLARWQQQGVTASLESYLGVTSLLPQVSEPARCP